ncbi:MAG TPA: cytochrome b/b6 domain-containing protein [Acidimicrobiales bacterium]|nr:cytochrome b/b6 domain-containing protein [Acidimicrobiales bacterium]
MAATTSRSEPRPARPGLVRFDRTERLLHWATALLFLVLLLTAALLYMAPLSAMVGRRGVVRLVHLWAGLALPVPYLVARAGPWSRALRVDVARLARFDATDSRWVRSLGRSRAVPLGKFHPLQKLNAAFTGGAIAVMLGTGAVMYWFEPFPLAWRTGATFVHDWLALALFGTIAVHIAKAVGDRDALGAMWHGRVTRRWARGRHPLWADEMAGAAAQPHAAQALANAPTSGSQDRSS